MKPDESTLISPPHLDSTYGHAPPEIKDDAPIDPFAVDVYMVGRLIFAWLKVRGLYIYDPNVVRTVNVIS